MSKDPARYRTALIGKACIDTYYPLSYNEVTGRYSSLGFPNNNSYTAEELEEYYHIFDENKAPLNHEQGSTKTN